MKVMVDNKPYYCNECLFGKSGEKCSLLLQDLNEKNRWDEIDILEDCPLISLNDLIIKTEVIGGGYEDSKLKISLMLNNEEITSDEFLYERYHGSMDD